MNIRFDYALISFRFLPAAILLLALTAVAAPSASDLPGLRDQDGNPVGLDATANRVQVAIVVTAKRLRRIKRWEKALREDFPDLETIRVADVPQTTSTDFDRVAKKLRRRLPEDLAVGIDVDGDWAAALEIDTSVPNILLFDPAGDLIFQQSGMYKDALYEPVRAALFAARTGVEAMPAVN